MIVVFCKPTNLNSYLKRWISTVHISCKKKQKCFTRITKASLTQKDNNYKNTR